MAQFVLRHHVDQRAFGKGTELVNMRGYCAIIHAYLFLLLVLRTLQVR